MSKQTAITKAIEDLLNLRVQYSHIDETMVTRSHVLAMLTELIPCEQEIIEAAYRQGSSDEIVDNEFQQFANSTDYFTKTFTENGNEL